MSDVTGGIERLVHQPVDPTRADVIPLKPGERRQAGFRKARRVTRNVANTETVLFRDMLAGLFGSDEAAEARFGKVLVSRAASDEVIITTIQAERVSNTTHFTVVTNPDEYEWLTVNLGESSWREAERDAGKSLGRYYRLTNLMGYILETCGNVQVDALQFASLPEGSPSYLIKGCERQESFDIANRRLAGALSLGAMALAPNEEDEMRKYLTYSIKKRIEYALDWADFTGRTGMQPPLDISTDMPHWKGICTPLELPDITKNLGDLWTPNPL